MNLVADVGFDQSFTFLYSPASRYAGSLRCPTKCRCPSSRRGSNVLQQRTNARGTCHLGGHGRAVASGCWSSGRRSVIRASSQAARTTTACATTGTWRLLISSRIEPSR